MSDHHVYKKVELVGSSRTTIEDAIENALVTASESLELMDWFEVTETRGHIENGKVGHYQVTFKVGFRISGS
ncbi:dodecin [uncultured Alcanivorax sp.]|jgi:flavin-binding protein dodecin|uniref:dodecin n=1 Tax=uncultured Alcanivorax sp. TaxID=191215 RepID=UPI00263477BC|nr:dodecin [uncultured Alcanivorax sp.]